MTERTDQPESTAQPGSSEQTEDSPHLDSTNEAGLAEEADVDSAGEPALPEDEVDAEQEPAEESDSPDDADSQDEIAASVDLGENAHQVVTALLGHQQDLVAELRGVYQRLEQVREVDYLKLENRVADTEYVVTGGEDIGAQFERLAERVEELTGAVNEQSQYQQQLADRLTEARDSFATQLADRDARIGAQNARIDELESAVTAAADSAKGAHEKADVLAEETQSRLIHRVQERVNPAAQQAKTALNNIAKRLRR